MDDLNKTIIACVAMVCITGLELYAINQGIDGASLSAVIAVLGAIVGYAFGFKIGKSETESEIETV